MTKTVIVCGSGLVGYNVLEVLAAKPNINLISVTRNPFYTRFLMGDNPNIKYVDYSTVDFNAAQYVINCVGGSHQDKIHSRFPLYLSRQIKTLDTKVINISSNAVLKNHENRTESADPWDTQFLGEYATHKLLGEIQHKSFYNIRTSFFGRHPYQKHQLLEWFLKQQDKCDGYFDYLWKTVN